MARKSFEKEVEEQNYIPKKNFNWLKSDKRFHLRTNKNNSTTTAEVNKKLETRSIVLWLAMRVNFDITIHYCSSIVIINRRILKKQQIKNSQIFSHSIVRMKVCHQYKLCTNLRIIEKSIITLCCYYDNYISFTNDSMNYAKY